MNSDNMTKDAHRSSHLEEIYSQREERRIEDLPKGCFFQDVPSKGYTLAYAGQACLIMTNVFLGASLLYLASEDADCLLDDDEAGVDTECTNRVYGFNPSALISNIAVIQGLLSAFLSPLLGAIIDYTDYRREVGQLTAIFIVVVSGAQIGTVSSTWFIMAILQAIVGFVYEVQYMTALAYLPEITTRLGNAAMNIVNQNAHIVFYTAQLAFIVVITGVSIALSWDDITTAQASQGLYLIVGLICFVPSWWKMLPKVAARHKLQEAPEGEPQQRLLTAGFAQNWYTCKALYKHYRKGLFWYFLMTCLAEAGTTALTPIAITYLSEALNFSGAEIGIVFLCALVGSIPGTWIATRLIAATNPNFAMKMGLLSFVATTTSGAFVISEERSVMAFVWGFLWGIGFGWYYAVQQIFFVLAVPPGQEAELAGFLVYCQLILSWFPPLIFSIMVEAGARLEFGLLILDVFQVGGVLLLLPIPSWEAVLHEARTGPGLSRFFSDFTKRETDVSALGGGVAAAAAAEQSQPSSSSLPSPILKNKNTDDIDEDDEAEA